MWLLYVWAMGSGSMQGLKAMRTVWQGGGRGGGRGRGRGRGIAMLKIYMDVEEEEIVEYKREI